MNDLDDLKSAALEVGAAVGVVAQKLTELTRLIDDFEDSLHGYTYNEDLD